MIQSHMQLGSGGIGQLLNWSNQSFVEWLKGTVMKKHDSSFLIFD